MNITTQMVEEVLKTLPIGYYLGRRVPVVLDAAAPTSFVNLPTSEIHVAVANVEAAVSKMKKPSAADIEAATRCALYHELSHVILTPQRLMRYVGGKLEKDWFNILEDARIEKILGNYYMGVNFPWFVRAITGGEKDAEKARSLTQYIYCVVRYRKGPATLVAEWDALVAAHTETALSDPYLLAIAYKEFVRHCKENRNAPQKQELQEQQQEQQPQESQDGEGDGNGEGTQSEDAESEENQSEESGGDEESGETGDDEDDAEEGEETDGAEEGDGDDEADTDGDDTDESDEAADGDGEDDGESDGEDELGEGEEGDETDGEDGSGDDSEAADGEAVDEDGETSEEGEQDGGEDGEAEHNDDPTGEDGGKPQDGEDDEEAEDDGEDEDERQDPNAFPPPSREQIAQTFERILDPTGASATTEQALRHTIFRALRKAGATAGRAYGYTGKVDPRSVGRRGDYRWFAKSNGDDARKGTRLHLTLCVDCSGSFSGDIGHVNGMITALNKLEKTTPDFTFDVVRMVEGVTKWDKRVPLEACGGNWLDGSLAACIKASEKPGWRNMTVVVWDGIFHSRWAWCPNISDADAERDLAALNNRDTVIVSDKDNERYLAKFAPKARTQIITSDYATTFIGRVCELLDGAI